MELKLGICIRMLSIGTGLCLALCQLDSEFLLECSFETSTSRPSDWTAIEVVNRSLAYCKRVPLDIAKEPHWTHNTSLVIVFIAAGALAGVSLTLCLISFKLLRQKSKFLAKRRKNATELRTASRNTLHFYESVGSLAIDSRHPVYQNQNSLEGHTLSPIDTYINAPLTNLEHHSLYINTAEEEINVPHNVHYAVSKTSKESEHELLTSISIIDLADFKDMHIPFSTVSPTTCVSQRHSHKISANDQLDWDNENNGYIIPITPTNSQMSLTPSVILEDAVTEVPASATNEQIL